jgi:CRISPR/Cas system CSM-associated protein Csm4 (group 5 of RAMP superfamily)
MSLHNGEKDRIAKRRRIIAGYRLRGIENTWELMALLEKEHNITVSERTVYYDKEAIEKQWLEDSKVDNEKRKANLIHKYEYIHREALAAWLKSLEDAETTIQEMIDGGEIGTAGASQRLKASTRKEGQSGNPALLAQAQAALKAIREMFGVDAATKVTNFNYDLSKATDEQLQRIAAGDDPATVLQQNTATSGG